MPGPDYVDRGAYCADTRFNPQNCGACGTVCPAAQRYCQWSGLGSGSTCVTCASVGLVECNNTCISVLYDNANCGGGGIVCTTAQTCINGVCVEGNRTDSGP